MRNLILATFTTTTAWLVVFALVHSGVCAQPQEEQNNSEIGTRGGFDAASGMSSSSSSSHGSGYAPSPSWCNASKVSCAVCLSPTCANSNGPGEPNVWFTGYDFGGGYISPAWCNPPPTAGSKQLFQTVTDPSQCLGTEVGGTCPSSYSESGSQTELAVTQMMCSICAACLTAASFCPASSAPSPTDIGSCYLSADDCSSGCDYPCQLITNGCIYEACPSETSPKLAVTTCEFCLSCAGAAAYVDVKQDVTMCYDSFTSCLKENPSAAANCRSATEPFNAGCSAFECPTTSTPSTYIDWGYCLGTDNCGQAYCVATQSCYLTLEQCENECRSIDGHSTECMTNATYYHSDNYPSCAQLPSNTQRFAFKGSSYPPAFSCQTPPLVDGYYPMPCSWCESVGQCVQSDCSCGSLEQRECMRAQTDCIWCSWLATCVNASANEKCTAPCETLDKASCDASATLCRWCDDIYHCAYKFQTCECWQFNSTEGCTPSSLPINGATQCSWCSNLGTCVGNDTRYCDCYNLSVGHACVASKQCDNCGSSVGDALNLCVPKALDCSCSSLPTSARVLDRDGNSIEQDVCELTASCSTLPGVLDTASAPYCARSSSSYATCPPVTCAQIVDDPTSCSNAQCNIAGSSCAAGSCFTFLVPGFSPQPIVLILSGFAKDVLTLILVGAFGDYLMRRLLKILFLCKNKVAEMFARCKRDCFGLKVKRIAMDKTVYIGDAVCRDKCNFNFEEYCAMVATALFKIEDGGVLTERANVRRTLQRLRDAVAFALVSTSCWIFVPDVLRAHRQLAQQQHSASATTQDILHRSTAALARAVEDAQEHGERGESDAENEQVQRDEQHQQEQGGRKEQQQQQRVPVEPTPTAATTTTVVNSPRDDGDDDEVQKHQQPGSASAAATTEKATTTSAASLVDHRRTITATEFNSLPTLQQLVVDAVELHAHSLVYYANSRDKYQSVALALNSFPTALQVGYYSLSIVLLFATTLAAVVFNEDNKLLISRVVAALSCTATSTANNAVGNNTMNHAAMNTTAGTISSSSFDFVSFILVGYHVMNASLLSTAVLVIVKTARAVFHYIRDDYDQLPLAERLPLMGLYGSRTLQVVIAVYMMLITPFVLVAPTYGWSQGWQVGVPVIVAAVLVAVVVVALQQYSKRVVSAAQKSKSHGQTQSADDDNFARSVRSLASELDTVVDECDVQSETAVRGAADTSSTHAAAATSVVKSTAFLRRSASRDDLNESLLSNNADAVALNAGQDDRAAASRREMLLALGEFLLKEELPTVILTLGLQLSFNYFALLSYAELFGAHNDHSKVMSMDWSARSVECVVNHLRTEVANLVAAASSFMPFM